MTSAQLAAVTYLARYSGPTHTRYAAQLRRWFGWCESNGLEPLIGIQRAPVELYIRQLGESGLMDSSVSTMMHGAQWDAVVVSSFQTDLIAFPVHVGRGVTCSALTI